MGFEEFAIHRSDPDPPRERDEEDGSEEVSREAGHGVIGEGAVEDETDADLSGDELGD